MAVQIRPSCLETMTMKRRTATVGIITAVVGWNVCLYFILGSKSSSEGRGGDFNNVHRRLDELNSEIERHVLDTENLLLGLRQIQQEQVFQTLNRSVDILPLSTYDNVTIAVLVVGCNRPDAIRRTLDQLLRYRYSETKFPIVVSLDCDHQPTINVVRTYGDKVTLILQPDPSEPALPWQQRKFLGYYKIARHYKWALAQLFHNMHYNALIAVEDHGDLNVPENQKNLLSDYYAISRHYRWMLSQTFNTFKFDVAIIVEDDLDIAPDFFDYFASTYPVLHSDPSLWCVSAWNDNGKTDLVEDNAELLYRSDFFPGLGWMLEKKVWLELEHNWPRAFWDDWMRNPEQRKNRACIRPEISRTSTFGKIGVSRGQYFEKHLKFIRLSDKFVPFREMDLSYLLQPYYDTSFLRKVYLTPQLTLKQVLQSARPELPAVRVEYDDEKSFKHMAKSLGFMDDFRAGVPRAAYHGIVSLWYLNRRLYIAPPVTWRGYETNT